jgi:hypothetical protein
MDLHLSGKTAVVTGASKGMLQPTAAGSMFWSTTSALP